jgi:8-oxo-dGTP pyrophosphatase MutT (NUDIX family)
MSLDEVERRCASFPAPRHRPIHVEIEDPRPAAVLVPIVDQDGEAAVVVTRRPASMTYHGGDWVFPGGRVEPEIDGSTAEAALREGCEELGIAASQLGIAGPLDTHGPIITGFLIHPFVGIIAPGTPLSPDPREVEEAMIVPLSSLMAKGAFRSGGPMPEHDPGPVATTSVAPLPAGDERPLHFFECRPGEDLWGMQANILCNFLEHLVAR